MDQHKDLYTNTKRGYSKYISLDKEVLTPSPCKQRIDTDVNSHVDETVMESQLNKAEVRVEAVTKGGGRFMAAWREEEEDAARHRQGEREATRLGKFLSHTEA